MIKVSEQGHLTRFLYTFETTSSSFLNVYVLEKGIEAANVTYWIEGPDKQCTKNENEYNDWTSSKRSNLLGMTTDSENKIFPRVS